MDFREYQRLATRTARKGDFQKDLVNAALGLTGEAGEVADEVKKHVFHGHGLDAHKLKKELGDILWYVAWAASTLGLDLSEIAAANIDKLKKRYPNGFSESDSINRKEE
jgi:NTP pyrophosphatase (non-canonical NTP hydrolase)